MLDKLLATAANNVKLAIAAAAGAALVAGGSAVAIQQVADETASTPTVTVSTTDTGNVVMPAVSDTSTGHVKTPKPSKSPKAEGAQGVHGACVSAVAHDKTLVGREHGKAVSEAAHSCPKGDDADEDSTATADADDNEADDADDADEAGSDEAAKPAKEHGKSASHKPSKD